MIRLRKIISLVIIFMMFSTGYSATSSDIVFNSTEYSIAQISPYIKGRKKSAKRRKRKSSFKKAHGQSRVNAKKHKDMSNKRKGPRVYGKKKKAKSWGGSFF